MARRSRARGRAGAVAVALSVALVHLAPGCGDGAAPVATGGRAPLSAAPIDAGPPPVEAFQPDGDARSEEAALAEAGALPAWRGVIERRRLLARRGDEGALFGVLASDPDGGGRLLVDDREGRGALFVRIRLPDADTLMIGTLVDGARIVAWGAFEADGDAWRFAARRVARLVDLPDRPAPRLPSHAVLPASPLPDGASGPSALAAAVQAGLRRQQHEATLVFTVVGAPLHVGDGWTVSDAPGEPPVAVVELPGEAPIYGGLDYRSADERWSVRPGATYAVPVIVNSRLRRTGGLALFSALDAPAEASPLPPAAPDARPPDARPPDARPPPARPSPARPSDARPPPAASSRDAR